MAIPYSTDPVQNELFEIRSAITDLNALVAREQERASFREELIDRLHGENQTLRRSELDTTLEPVRGGLYRLYDLSSREAARWQLASTEGQPQSADQPPTQDGPLFGVFAEQVGALFTAFAEEVLEVLGRIGVEAFEVKAGELYDASMHRPVETVRVDHPSWDGAVVQMVSAGFVRGETVLRRADVVVGQHGSAT
ncbi:hypothetical protein GCM10009765_32840 [Fodinicola feengrottensis]|uniref:Nucleotide exchange factor GrpE n=1 Tax=Fodinicola feengrottensis TaxID=435914 RepID=A0ABN2H350_9ACTN